MAALKAGCVLVILGLLAGCAPPGGAPASLPTAHGAEQGSDPAPWEDPACPLSRCGVLQGEVSIGPFWPSIRIGEPTPTPPPEVFTSRSLVILAVDAKTELARVPLLAEGAYRVALLPGVYVLAYPGHGKERAVDLPRQVEIKVGQITQLDVDIDTGMR